MFAGVDAAADAELLTGKLKDVVAFGEGVGDRLAARARRRACGDALLGICRPLGPAGGSKLSSDADRISSLRLLRDWRAVGCPSAASGLLDTSSLDVPRKGHMREGKVVDMRH